MCRPGQSPREVLPIVQSDNDILRQKVEASSRYAEILEATPDFVGTADADGRTLSVNRAGRHMLGIGEEEDLSGKHIREYHPDWAQKLILEEGVPTAMREGTWSGETALLRRGGREIPISQVIIVHKAEGGQVEYLSTIARDITERKRAEEALKKSEERYRLLVESVKDYAMFMMDPQGRIANWNAGAQRLFGYREEEVVGEYGSLLFIPEDRRNGVPERELRKAFEKGRAEDERWHMRKEGGRFWASGIVTPMRDETGNLQGFIKVARDLTERKRDQEERERLLAESERRAAELNAVIESIPDAVYVGNEDGIALCNEPALEMLGFESVEELNRQIHLLAERLRTRYADTGKRIPSGEEVFELALRGETRAREVIARHLRTGEDVILRSAAAPIRHEGTIVGAVALNTDITERKRIEEALRLRDRAVAASSNGIIITDPRAPDNPIVYTNPGFERITGYAAEEVLGRNCRFLQGEDRDQPQLEEVRSAIREERHCTVVLRNYRKDGVLFFNELSISPVHDEQGELVNFIGVQADVTERVRAGENLRRANERITDILESITDAFFALDREWRFTYLNAEAERVLLRSREELLGTNVWEEFPEAIGSKFYEEYHRVLSEQVTTHFEELYPPFGIWFDVKVYPSEEGLSIFFRDVTERKRANEVLRAHAAQQAAVAQLGRLAIVEGDDLQKLMDQAVELVARVLRVEYCKVLELLPDGEELLLRAGVGWREGLVGRATVDAGLDSQAGYTLLSGEPVVVEDLRTEERFSGPPLLREHGVTSGMSAVIRGQERPYGVLGAHTEERRVFTDEDVNFLRAVANVLAASIERTAAERDLRRQEEIFRSLSASSPVGIFLTDLEGRCTYTNPRCQQICGFTFEEALGEGWARLVHPDDRDRVFEEWSAHTRKGREYSQEFRFVNPHRGTTWVHARSSPLSSDNGDVLGHVGTVEDITGRKAAERTLHEIRESERRRIARDLHDVVLQDLSATVQELQATELEYRSRGMDVELGQAAGTLRSASRGLREAIYDLRSERGQRFVRSVQSVVESSHQLSAELVVRLEVEEGFPDNLPEKVSVELLRIVQEALTNVRRHSGARNATVILRIDENEVCVKVEDDGRGFAPDIRRSGIGLSGMRERVEGLGGELEVKSESGKGTKVAAKVPLPAGPET